MSAGGEIPRPVRKNQNDFSDALRKRGIEEVNTPRFAGASTNTSPDQGKPKTENRNGEHEEGFAGDRFGLENMQR